MQVGGFCRNLRFIFLDKQGVVCNNNLKLGEREERMERTIDDTLVYVRLLTRHTRKDDVSAAILALLIELGFQSGVDGFGYLRRAIMIRFRNPDIRLAAIYQELIHIYGDDIDAHMIDQAIRSCIEYVWNCRDLEKWNYFFPTNRTGKQGRPSNMEFISRVACFMELWNSRR